MCVHVFVCVRLCVFISLIRHAAHEVLGLALKISNHQGTASIQHYQQAEKTATPIELFTWHSNFMYPNPSSVLIEHYMMSVCIYLCVCVRVCF